MNPRLLSWNSPFATHTTVRRPPLELCPVPWTPEDPVPWAELKGGDERRGEREGTEYGERLKEATEEMRGQQLGGRMIKATNTQSVRTSSEENTPYPPPRYKLAEEIVGFEGERGCEKKVFNQPTNDCLMKVEAGAGKAFYKRVRVGVGEFTAGKHAVMTTSAPEAGQPPPSRKTPVIETCHITACVPYIQ